MNHGHMDTTVPTELRYLSKSGVLTPRRMAYWSVNIGFIVQIIAVG
jgi:hypothetical protein